GAVRGLTVEPYQGFILVGYRTGGVTAARRLLGRCVRFAFRTRSRASLRSSGRLCAGCRAQSKNCCQSHRNELFHKAFSFAFHSSGIGAFLSGAPLTLFILKEKQRKNKGKNHRSKGKYLSIPIYF